jgi:hypothetical protein
MTESESRHAKGEADAARTAPPAEPNAEEAPPLLAEEGVNEGLEEMAEESPGPGEASSAE